MSMTDYPLSKQGQVNDPILERLCRSSLGATIG